MILIRVDRRKGDGYRPASRVRFFYDDEALTMRKKKTLVLGGLSLLLAAGVVTVLIFMVRHEPSFYHRVEVAPGKIRQEMSRACFGRFVDLKNYWQVGQKEWEVIITEAQLNSYFEEDFIKHHKLAPDFRKWGISDPRIAMENDKLRLAFRYGSPPWSTIISYDVKLWLAKEVNVICIEFLGRHAGALPIATQSLLAEISEVAEKNGFEITWYRHEGNPVALVRIQQGTETPAQLRRLEVKQGWISIGGLSQEPALTDNGKQALVPLGN
jgi:hypothetical protein